MRARIRYSSAPHRETLFERVLHPIVILCNLGVAAWFFPSWQTARVQWVPGLDSLWRTVENRSTPIIYYTWHAYELLAACAFRDVRRDLWPTAIGHDGLASRVLQHAMVWFGFSLWVYRRRSPWQPKQQLIDLLRREPQSILALFPDSGGPDGEVRPGLVEVARETGALLVPIAVRACPVLIVGSSRRYGLPLPFCTVTAFHGDPVDGRGATSQAIQKALEEQDNRARRIGEPEADRCTQANKSLERTR